MSNDEGQFSPAELLESLGQAVIATELDGTIVCWNAAAEQLYGWPAADALGRDIAQVTVPHVSQDVAAGIMRALRDGDSWAGGFAVQRRDGSVFPALVTDTGIYRDGRLVGLVGASANLGTAVRPLLERSADAAIVVTADAIITYASPSVLPLFGWQPDELIGKPLTSLIHPQDQDCFYESVRSIELPEPGRVLELRVRGTDGWIATEAVLTDLLDDQVVRGVVCNLHHSERMARLQERERISQSVHADILQILYGATLDLDTLAAGSSDQQRAGIDAAVGKIADAISTLRQIVRAEGE